MKKYKLGLLDPPWTYDNKQQNDPKRGGIIYPTLTMKELYDIPIGNAFDKDSLIVVWVTAPKLMDEYYEKYNPISIIRNWGFRPITFIFTWIKLNRNARKSLPFDIQDQDWPWYHKDNFYSGLGRYTNSNSEYAIVARKGKGLPRIAKDVKQLIIAPIGIHSAKPKEQYDRLDRLYGNVPRVELFARSINAPPIEWDAVGLEYEPSVDIKDWIKQYDIT